MTRIQIAARITGHAADVLALNSTLIDAVENQFVFTMSADDRLFVNVDDGDLPAALAVLHDADELGQIDVYASETNPLLAASI